MNTWRCIHCNQLHDGAIIRRWRTLEFSLCPDCDALLFPPFPWGKFTLCVGILILFGLIVL